MFGLGVRANLVGGWSQTPAGEDENNPVGMSQAAEMEQTMQPTTRTE